MKTFFALLLILVAQASLAMDFTKKKLSLDGKILEVEVADREDLRQQGLMNRKTLDEGKGMIFVFGSESPQSFWMKNTYVPLSIAFFDSKKKMVDVFDMNPEISEAVANPRIYRSNKLSQYALEVPQGWFKKNGIKVGAKFEFLDEKSSSKPTPVETKASKPTPEKK